MQKSGSESGSIEMYTCHVPERNSLATHTHINISHKKFKMYAYYKYILTVTLLLNRVWNLHKETLQISWKRFLLLKVFILPDLSLNGIGTPNIITRFLDLIVRKNISYLHKKQKN